MYCHSLQMQIFIPPAQRSCWGGYWFHCPSVCLSRIPCPLCSTTVLIGSISCLSILSSNFRCVACRASCIILKIEFLANFFKFVTLILSVLTWDLKWITSMGNHGAAGGISQRSLSSWSNLFKFHFNLKHCGLVTPYGDRDLDQYWFR